MYDEVFKINLDTLVVQLLPPRLQKPRMIAFLRLIITPLKQQLADLVKHRALTIYQLSHSSQLGSVEKVLNDAFDGVERRIRIKNSGKKNATYIYTAAENRPKYTPFFLSNGSDTAEEENPLKVHLKKYTPFYIYTEKETASVFLDFTVYIPYTVALTPSDLIRAESLVRYYALQDKTFKIIRV